MKLAVVADPHVSVLRDEPDSWHNPYRLGDAHERLDAALRHPLFADADAFALLGDLAHFGDAASLKRVVQSVATARAGRPAVLLSGNHDVLVDGVRIEDEVEAWGDPAIVAPNAWPPGFGPAKVFEAAGLGLHVHDVTGMRAGDVRPFDVVARSIIKPSSAAPTVVLTHFPILSFEERAREAGLLYSGHLNQLASVTGPTTMTGPIVVLSGHLHLRAVTVESEALQLCFAALVEAPYELALVELERADGGLDVSYRCASARPPDAERLPVLDPADGAWRWRPGAGWHQA